jgi:hypothetical protein
LVSGDERKGLQPQLPYPERHAVLDALSLVCARVVAYEYLGGDMHTAQDLLLPHNACLALLYEEIAGAL